MERKSLCIRQNYPRLTTVFSGHPLSFQANMRIEAYAFGCKGSATFLNGQNKTRSLFSSPRHETSWKEADSNDKRSWPLGTEGKKTGNTLRETKPTFHPFFTFPPDAGTMTFGERRPMCKRRCSQTRTSLGADSDVAGSRFGCRCSQMQVCLVPDALRGIGNETMASKQKKWHTTSNGFPFKETIICHVPFCRNGSFRFHSITNHLLSFRAPV